MKDHGQARVCETEAVRSRGAGSVDLEVDGAEQLWAAVVHTLIEDVESAVRRAQRRLERVDLGVSPDSWLVRMSLPGAVEGAIQARLDLLALIREVKGRRMQEVCDFAGVSDVCVIEKVLKLAAPTLSRFEGDWWRRAFEVREKVIGVRPFTYISQPRRPRGPDGRLLSVPKVEADEEDGVISEPPSF